MFWQEDDRSTKALSDIVDVLFRIRCRELPVDHLWPLSQALRTAAPWLDEDPRVAIHEIHVAGSQNGWERPGRDAAQQLVLSRRTRLILRMPRERLEQACALEGITIDVAGHPLTIGEFKTRELSKLTTLFSRHLLTASDEDENAFLERIAAELRQRGIRVRKALCGKPDIIDTPHGVLHTRSLMLADLATDEAIELQEQGLGEHQKLGCGIFIPHKDIEAVKKIADDETSGIL